MRITKRTKSKKPMSPELQRTLLLATFIRALLEHYAEDERTAIWLMLEKRIVHKMAEFRVQYGKSYARTLKLGNLIWQEAIDDFADRKIRLEATYTISELTDKDENALRHYFKLDNEVIAKFYDVKRTEDFHKMEKDSREIADYLYKSVSNHLGLEVEVKDRSALKDIIARAKERA